VLARRAYQRWPVWWRSGAADLFTWRARRLRQTDQWRRQGGHRHMGQLGDTPAARIPFWPKKYRHRKWPRIFLQFRLRPIKAAYLLIRVVSAAT